MVARRLGTARFRRDERGTAIFVVVLVITLLTGVGLFAARVTGSVDAATGYARQATQAKALAIYAAQLAPAVLSLHQASIQSDIDLTEAGTKPNLCAAGRYAQFGQCSIRNHSDLETIAKTSVINANPVLSPQTTEDPGSLGPPTGLTTTAGVEGNLRVEYFERVQTRPQPGNTNPGFEYTVAASAQIRPLIGAVDANWCGAANSTASANVQAVRMYVIVP